jgi:hypothetical protein
VLVPMNFARITRDAMVKVGASWATSSPAGAGTRQPDQVTMLEEEKIMAYYGAGTLYATPAARSRCCEPGERAPCKPRTPPPAHSGPRARVRAAARPARALPPASACSGRAAPTGARWRARLPRAQAGGLLRAMLALRVIANVLADGGGTAPLR